MTPMWGALFFSAAGGWNGLHSPPPELFRNERRQRRRAFKRYRKQEAIVPAFLVAAAPDEYVGGILQGQPDWFDR